MKEAVFYKCSWAPYYLNVHILIDGVYAGIGRFCETAEELAEFCKYYEVEKITRIEEV